MLNVGGPEVLVILLVALIVLGPQQLPKAVRSVGNVMAELRRMSNGFQDEIRNALDVSTEAEAREEGAKLAQRPEDADITETVARNTDPHLDSDPDPELDPAGLDLDPADAAAPSSGSTALTRSADGSSSHPVDHDDWVPSDRASG